MIIICDVRLVEVLVYVYHWAHALWHVWKLLVGNVELLVHVVALDVHSLLGAHLSQELLLLLCISHVLLIMVHQLVIHIFRTTNRYLSIVVPVIDFVNIVIFSLLLLKVNTIDIGELTINFLARISVFLNFSICSRSSFGWNYFPVFWVAFVHFVFDLVYFASTIWDVFK